MRITDHPERHRYTLDVDGQEAAEIVYHLRGADKIEFEHTEVKKEFEGQGLASRIAAFAFDDARKRGLKVIPSCSYIQRFLAKHPEYEDLVAQR